MNPARRVNGHTPQKRRHSEIIGRTTSLMVYPRLLRASGGTWDSTSPDYVFWDMFRRSKKTGYELASLFANGVIQTLSSWVLGKGILPAIQSDRDPTYTNQLLQQWGQRQNGTLGAMVQDLYALGNQYVIVNLDGTLSIPSPDTVEVKRDPLDYRRLTEVTIKNSFTNAEVTDTFTAPLRTIRIKNLSGEPLNTQFGVISANELGVFEFDNPLGVLPVVHFPNMASANEVEGRPIYESLLRLFSRYDDLLEKALDGAEVLSDPIPVFTHADDLEDVITRNTVSTGDTDDAGNDIRRLDLSALKAFFTTGDAKFLSPGEFTGDIRSMLKVLFLLMLEHTRIPEAVWGGELSSARASAEEQMKTFYMYIDWLRVLLEGSPEQGRGGLLQLVQLWLSVKALTDPQVIPDGNLSIQWTELAQQSADLRQKKIEYAHSHTLLSDDETLALLDLVEDPAQSVLDARADADVRRLQLQDPFDAAMAADLMDASV